MKPVAWCIVVLSAVAAGCASRQTTGGQTQPTTQAMRPAGTQTQAEDAMFDALEEELAQRDVEVDDPLEGWNRAVFVFNDALYVWVAKPVLEGYEAVVPEPARESIGHAFDNVAMPVRAVNCVLQGKWDGAGRELHRFGINSTIGILGFRDAARDDFMLEPASEDLGQTLGSYGADGGWYLVWPIFGPSNVRDSIGRVGDQFLNPLRYIQPDWVSYTVSGVRATNAGSLNRHQYEALKAESVDPYVAFRQAYAQYRRKQIQE